MISSPLLRTLFFSCFLLLSLPVIARGWDTGSEYLYDYNGLLVTGLEDVEHESAAVQITGKLTVQSIDEETLMLKLSEIRVTRDGNYSGSGRPSDPIWLPVALPDGEKEAIGDSLHLLSPFAVIHNKGSVVNLVVENDEPVWSINMKKAVASHLQLDVSGVRSGLDGGVFGERNAALNSLEDGVTGDCLATLRITRLPFYQVIQDGTDDKHRVIGDVCRTTKIYEITKIKDFDQCRNDPLQTLSNPPSASSFMSHGIRTDGTLQRFAAYKYLACGESTEKAIIVRMEGVGELVYTGPVAFKTEQIVSLMLQRRQPIRDLLPPLTQPKLEDGLTYSFDEAPAPAVSVEEAETVLGTLHQVALIIVGSTTSEIDISEKLETVSQTISRLNETQLQEIWERVFLAENGTVRDLFVDCAATSGSHTAVAFLLDLIERRELGGFQAVWTLMSSGHSIRRPKNSLLRRFVDIIQSEPAQISKLLKRTALMVAADLLYTSCVLSTVTCNPDAQVITETFLPLLVSELENAGSAADRLATILALGSLGVDDVLLLLVPYIRGEDVATRIAAIHSLQRLMDSSSEKVIPLLASIADNVAERPEVRMTAISSLLFHKKTPLSLWKKIASRTWFEPNHQVRALTCDLIQSFSGINAPEDESTSRKARSVISLVRPCAGRSEFEHYATVKDNTAGLLSLLAFWKLSDSSLPVYLHHQLFRQLGSFRLNLAQVSIWNYNMEVVWNRLLGRESPQPNGAKLSDIWDQLSLRFRPNDQPTGLFHVKLLGSTMQSLFNLEDIDRDRIGEFLTGRLNIRLVKFQQLVDIRTDVPTELGLPARFTFSLDALASAMGRIRQPEINVTASLSFKWTAESRVECPFSRHHVATGMEHRAEIRLPVSLMFNDSFEWIPPPDRLYDLAYYHVKPYRHNRRTQDHLAKTADLETIEIPPVVISAIPLATNLRLETTDQLPQGDSASVWLNRLMKGDFSSFRSDGSHQLRMYRLRYQPVDSPLSSVSLSASFQTVTIQEEALDDVTSANETENEDSPANDTSNQPVIKDRFRVFQSGIAVHYLNGSSSNWAHLEMVSQSSSEEKDDWNVTISGPSPVRLLRNCLNFQNIGDLHEVGRYSKNFASDYNETSRLSKIQFSVKESDIYSSFLRLKPTLPIAKISKCLVHSDRVVTYDGVEYNYTLNECHHLLTADCGQKATKYAVTAHRNKFLGMTVRITLEKDVIDVSSSGNISINGIDTDYNANRMRIHVGEKLIATATQKQDNSIHLDLPYHHLNIVVEKSVLTLSAGKQLLGQACGLCGDGDSEVTGEFKTGDRCALSSGALMAASFQVNVGPEECPSLPDEVLQTLLKESYPCYSVDEQVASVLPLPPES